MLHRDQNRWKNIEQYSAVHPLIKISITGFFCLCSIGMVLGMADSTEAHSLQSTSVVGMIENVFGPHAHEAIRVAQCESSLNSQAYNPIAVGGSHSAGVFQILYPSTWSGTSQAGKSPYNPLANIIAAHDIFVRDGYTWRAWVCRP